MQRKDYLILLFGILIIAMSFYKFRKFEYAFILAIIGILVFILIFFFFLMLKEKLQLKKDKNTSVYIFSCCFINDDVNFSRLYRIISKKVIRNLFKTAEEFIKYLKEKNILIKFNGKETIEKINKEINFLLKENNIDLEIEDDSFGDLDFISYLNLITKRIREKEYELVQIYPASMYNKKTYYYFVLVPLDRLLDLGEIGFLG